MRRERHLRGYDVISIRIQNALLPARWKEREPEDGDYTIQYRCEWLMVEFVTSITPAGRGVSLAFSCHGTTTCTSLPLLVHLLL